MSYSNINRMKIPHIRVNIYKQPMRLKDINSLRDCYSSEVTKITESLPKVKNGFFLLFVGLVTMTIINVPLAIMSIDLYIGVVIGMSIAVISQFEEISSAKRSQGVAPVSLMAASIPFFVHSGVTTSSGLSCIFIWVAVNAIGNKIAKRYRNDARRMEQLKKVIKALSPADDLTMRKIAKCREVACVKDFLSHENARARRLTLAESSAILDAVSKVRLEKSTNNVFEQARELESIIRPQWSPTKVV